MHISLLLVLFLHTSRVICAGKDASQSTWEDYAAKWSSAVSIAVSHTMLPYWLAVPASMHLPLHLRLVQMNEVVSSAASNAQVNSLLLSSSHQSPVEPPTAKVNPIVSCQTPCCFRLPKSLLLNPLLHLPSPQSPAESRASFAFPTVSYRILCILHLPDSLLLNILLPSYFRQSLDEPPSSFVFPTVSCWIPCFHCLPNSLLLCRCISLLVSQWQGDLSNLRGQRGGTRAAGKQRHHCGSPLSPIDPGGVWVWVLIERTWVLIERTWVLIERTWVLRRLES